MVWNQLVGDLQLSGRIETSNATFTVVNGALRQVADAVVETSGSIIINATQDILLTSITAVSGDIFIQSTAGAILDGSTTNETTVIKLLSSTATMELNAVGIGQANSTGDLEITSVGPVRVRSAGGDVALTFIQNANDSTRLGSITTGTGNLRLQTEKGHLILTQPLQGTNTLIQSAGNLVFAAGTQLTTSGTSQVIAAGDIQLSRIVYSNGPLTLRAGGVVIDADPATATNGTEPALISGVGSLSLSAAGLGSAASGADVDLEISDLANLELTGGNAWLQVKSHPQGSGLRIGTVTAGDGSIQLETSGSDTAVYGAVQAGQLTWVATGALTMEAGTTLLTRGDLSLTAAGDLTMTRISSAGSTVALRSTTGSLRGIASDGFANVSTSAADVNLRLAAAGSIGSSGAAMQLSVDRLASLEATGLVNLVNDRGLVLSPMSALTTNRLGGSFQLALAGGDLEVEGLWQAASMALSIPAGQLTMGLSGRLSTSGDLLVTSRDDQQITSLATVDGALDLVSETGIIRNNNSHSTDTNLLVSGKGSVRRLIAAAIGETHGEGALNISASRLGTVLSHAATSTQNGSIHLHLPNSVSFDQLEADSNVLIEIDRGDLILNRYGSMATKADIKLSMRQGSLQMQPFSWISSGGTFYAMDVNTLVSTSGDLVGSTFQEDAATVMNGTSSIGQSGVIRFRQSDRNGAVLARASLMEATTGGNAPVPDVVLAQLQRALHLSGAAVASASAEGDLNWSFKLDPMAVQHLGLGERITASYRVSLVDAQAAYRSTGTMPMRLEADAAGVVRLSQGTLDQVSSELASPLVRDSFLTFVITGSNDAPTISDASYGQRSNEAPIFQLPLASDPEGDALRYQLVAGSTTGGQVTLDENGSFVVSPSLAKNMITFSYVVSDGTAVSLPATATIYIADASIPQLTAPKLKDVLEKVGDPTSNDFLTSEGRQRLRLSGNSGATDFRLVQASTGQYIRSLESKFTANDQTYTIDLTGQVLNPGKYYVALVYGTEVSARDLDGFTIDSKPELLDRSIDRTIAQFDGLAVTLGQLAVVTGLNQELTGVQPGVKLSGNSSQPISSRQLLAINNWVDADGDSVTFGVQGGSLVKGFSQITNLSGSTLAVNPSSGQYFYRPGSNASGVDQFTVQVADPGGRCSVLSLEFNPQDTLVRSGVPSFVQSQLSKLAASATGSQAKSTDINNDSIADLRQLGFAVVPWFNVDTYRSAIQNSSAFNSREAIVTVQVNSALGGRFVSAYSELADLAVVPTTDKMNDYARVVQRGAATSASDGSAWDPLAITINPLISTGLVDLDPTRLGVQQQLWIDTSRTQLRRDQVDSYLIWVSLDDLDAYKSINTPLLDLDGVQVTNEGWYDFAARNGNGDGARFFYKDEFVVGVELTITNNSLGDSSALLDRISSLGTLVQLNYLASISGVSSGLLEEDGVLQAAGGQVVVTDRDAGQDKLSPLANSLFTGSYGSFELDSITGIWSYKLNNTSEAVQKLRQGEMVSEKLTVSSFDSTASLPIVVTIKGTNDAPVITNLSAAATGTVTEAGNLDDGTVVAGAPTATGTLGASDVDGTVRIWTLQGTAPVSYGGFAINATSGVWSYTLDNSKIATQALKEGESVTQTVTVRVTDEFGGYRDQVVSVVINGTNDGPVITSLPAAASGTVTEAGNLDDGTVVAGAPTATGMLSASDVDGTVRTWALQGVAPTTYGAFAFNTTSGMWTYTLDNSKVATQAMKEGESVTQTVTVRVTDEFGAYRDQVVSVVINGTNDAPLITNTTAALTGTVTEAGNLDDGTVVAGTPTATGTLSTSDGDGAVQAWTLQGLAPTTYGAFAVNTTSGVWSYTLDNTKAATQALKEGESVTQMVNIRVTDEFGAYRDQVVSVVIKGTNDAPLITNTTAALSGTVTEAGNLDDGTVVAGAPATGGSLSAGDVDGTVRTWALQGTVPTTYGAFAVNTTSGVWSYTLDNTKAATQALKEGESVTQTVSVRVTDEFGAYRDQLVSVLINGTNDAPVITNTSTALSGVVTEAGNLDDGTVVAGAPTATGTLSAIDGDGTVRTWTLLGTAPTTYGAFAFNPTTAGWSYTLDNTKASTQALKEGESVTQTVTIRVTDEFGAYRDQVVSVVIKGTNDGPVFTNLPAAASGTVTEAGNLDDGTVVAGTPTATGTLSASDGDGTVRTWSVLGGAATTYGVFAFNATTAVWTYTLDNGKVATQALKEGESVTQTVTIRVTDEFGAYRDQVVSVLVNGSNDGPVITNTTAALSGVMTEAGNLDDGTVVAGTPTATGALSASDVDGAVRTWTLLGTAPTTYGAFAVNSTSGVWSYTLDNTMAATQSLKEGESVTQTVTVRVSDEFGAYRDQVVSVVIKGTNDGPVITNLPAALSGTVTEAGNLDDGTVVAGAPTATGTLSASDVDGTVRTWFVLGGAAPTTYGAFALNATTAVWTYTLDNTKAATQALKEGESVTQTVTIRVTDEFGAYRDQVVSVLVNGSNDGPVITNTTAALSGVMTEAGNLDDGTVVAGTPTATGALSASDVDGAVRTWTLLGTAPTTYGAFAVNSTSGVWSYTLDNTMAATQSLKEGESVTQTVTVRVSDEFGAYRDQVVSVVIKGTNDGPVITNLPAALSGTVTEAGNLDDGTVVAGAPTATGTLSASDVDGTVRTWALQGVAPTTYGAFAFNATTAVWTYTLDNGKVATQALKEGESVTQTVTIRVTDEFGAYRDQVVSVLVNGSNDGPVITNTTAALSGVLTEAGNLDDGTVVAGTAAATGTLSASDVDGTVRTWALQGTAPTTYGAFAVNSTSGVWSYTLDNTMSSTQALKEGESVTQTVTVRVSDEFGAYRDQVVSVVIKGTNDGPVISSLPAAASGTVTEAGNLDDGTVVAGTPTATGTLSGSDVDGTVRTWALQGVVPTTYGAFAFNATTAVWTYTLDNTKAATQALKEGESVTQTVTIRVTDEFGAYRDQVVSVLVNGSNDGPVITNLPAALSGTVTEAGNLDDGTVVAGTPTATGALSASDVDGAVRTWALQGTAPTTYGTFAVNSTSGVWSYTLDNTMASTQSLKEGESVTQTVTMRVSDEFGAYRDQVVSVVIKGTNDGPVFTNLAAAASGTVTEAGNLDDGTVVAGTPTATGTLSASDVDGTVRTWALQGVAPTTYGAFAFNTTTAVWTYTLDNTKAATQALREGESVTQTVTIRVTDEFGAYRNQVVSVLIKGTNDGPVITNLPAALSGIVTEAGNLDDGTVVAGTPTATGALSATDVDGTVRTWALQGTAPTTYGAFAVNTTSGVWSYTLDNTKAATQALKEGESVTQTVTVRVSDEFGAYRDQVVSVVINGTNDGPVITNTAAALSGTVTEAGVLASGVATTGTSTATGALKATDFDGSILLWSIQGVPLNTYGVFSVNANTGVWTYQLDNNKAETQALSAGQTVTQTYQVRATDEKGAWINQLIQINIKGSAM
jgi:VCBS repeat-containing protein